MMTPKRRRLIERRIVRRLVLDMTGAGLLVSVFDGYATTVKRSRDVAQIMGALQTVDEESLTIRLAPKGEYVGTVFLVYGNDGWDVISDYSVALTPYMAGADAEAHRLETLFGGGF